MGFKQKSKAEALLFSVIVPAYNSELYIEKCIKSVLNQTYDNFELIIINDGSKDSTLEICEKYSKKDDRVSVFSQENSGHTAARNQGLLKSRGQYVLFLDSDDWLDADVLRVCNNEIIENIPDVIIYGVKAFGGGEILKNNIPDGVYDLKLNHNDILNSILMSSDGTFAFPKALSGKVFRKSIVAKNQLDIPKEVLIGEDGVCFVGSILDSETISVVSNVYYNFLIHDGSVSHTADKFSLSRHLTLLTYYSSVLKKKGVNINDQFDRFVVSQIYTAVQFVQRAKASRVWIKSEFNKFLADRKLYASVKRARFDKNGKKMKIKKFIIRYRLLGLVKLLDRSNKKQEISNERNK